MTARQGLWAVILAGCCSLPQTVRADVVRTEHSDWVVVQGADSCVVGTEAEGKSFRLYVDSEGAIWLIFELDQSLRSGRHIVELSVDENPLLRTVGDSDEKILAITLPAQDESSVILSKIIDGENLSLLDSMGIGVAQFSLSGSGKAINGYVQCLGTIEQG